jgi:uncharacterized protein YndB with AHSA1/START domain
MSTTTLEVTALPGERSMEFRRFVKAPPALVFDILTKPEHLRHWWGPRELELAVCELDLRVGGSYRFVQRAADGREFVFTGEYRVIDPPHKLSYTFVYEGAPDDVAVDTITLEPADGGTVIRGTSVHASVAARDQHLAAGMERGMTEAYERFDELVATLQDG